VGSSGVCKKTPLFVRSSALNSTCNKYSAQAVVVIKNPDFSPLVRISPSTTCHFASPVGCHPKVVSPSNSEIHPSSNISCGKNVGSAAGANDETIRQTQIELKNLFTDLPIRNSPPRHGGHGEET